MDQQIEFILQLVPAWHGLDATIIPLVGGITNQNYRVDIGDEQFVVRIGGKDTRLLGIDRERERTCTAVVARLGIGAEVIYAHSSDTAEVLVTRFLPGITLSPVEVAQPETLQRIVEVLQRYHAGPAFPGTFSPFETVRSYYQLALDKGVSFPEILPQVFSQMEQIETALRPVCQLRPCHNDLLASNFIDNGHSMHIIDWEYAGMGDLFFDLGNLAANQELDREQCELLLHAYFGELRSVDSAHLYLMRLASDLRESFWGFLQQGISTIDFNYQEYADHHLQRFLRNVSTPLFADCLREIHL
ncbi:MAG TPA: choline/ethanolamine kinase family protein [Ktedonobacteraceae bacterium]|nr:choline/ethanolamine kinase family protein [Ktedonobacteraceae bacterium]